MPDKMRLGSWFGLIRTGTDRSFGSGQRPINCLGHWRNSCCSSNSNLMSDELQVHNDAFWRYFFLLKAKTIFSGTIKLWRILISILLLVEKEMRTHRISFSNNSICCVFENNDNKKIMMSLHNWENYLHWYFNVKTQLMKWQN